MDGAQSLIRNGLAQTDLDMNHFRLLNLDTSNLPPAGTPPTIVLPDNQWLHGWDAVTLEWSARQPHFSDMAGFLTRAQQDSIVSVGILRSGTWQAEPILGGFLTTLDGIRAPLSNLNLNNRRIVNLADPVNPQDAVNKRFMDNLLVGLNPKEAVRLATTINTSPFGLPIIDGIQTVVGNRVLIKNNDTDPSGSSGPDNGIYIVSSGMWSRATDADTGAELSHAYVHVTEGNRNAGTSWVETLSITTINTDPVHFVVFSIGTDIQAGDGLDFDGNQLNVIGTAGRIVVGTTVDIDVAYAGQHSIHILGTIDDATWNGGIIDSAFGGTGVDNGGFAISIAGNLTLLLAPLVIDAGLTLNITGDTNVTFPTSGTLATRANPETFTNKRITKRVVKINTASAPLINTDNVDVAYLTDMGVDANMTTNLGGTPTDSQDLAIWFHDDGIPRNITWGAKFTAPIELTLPANTNPGLWLLTTFMYSTELSKWVLTGSFSHI